MDALQPPAFGEIGKIGEKQRERQINFNDCVTNVTKYAELCAEFCEKLYNNMCKKGSKLYSIFKLKCPRCHEGDTFETNSWSFVKPFDMLQRCPKCDLDYFPEPGYYYGAMFISYIWTGWFCLFFLGVFYGILGWSQLASFALLIGFMVINFVYVFRISRMMWININVRYDPNILNKK